MVELPPDTMFDILSRMSLKSLARLRCVRRAWCNYIDDPHLATIRVKEEPTPILFDKYAAIDNVSCSFRSYSIMKSKQVTTTSLELNMGPIFQFPCYRYLFYRFSENLVLGSCNGLLLSSQDGVKRTTFMVIHPLRKECYTLPAIEIWSGGNSCGLGFDDSNNSFKLVCVLNRIKEPLCTKVHVLGTNSWREIHQIPTYPITGEGIFANGCLHWLRCRLNSVHANEVIYFDVKKEEFGLIDPPKQIRADRLFEKLVDLQGEVGVVYNALRMNELTRIEVWVLKQKDWVMHCQFDRIHPISRGIIKVIGCWNKNGDILITADEDKQLFVYDVKNGILHETKINGWKYQTKSEIRMYQSNLVSIHGFKPFTQMFLESKTCQSQTMPRVLKFC